MRSQQTTQDYLKIIYYLAEEEEPVSTSRIAEARGTQPATVTKMLQKLDRQGLVHYWKHRGVSLTDKGCKMALETLRHHRLTELFLTEILGVSWDEVHEHAEILEHAIDHRLSDRIDALLGYPEFDPHGDPIPARDGSIRERNTSPLIELPVGSSFHVARILDDQDEELLGYLANLGLKPGAEVRIEEIAPFDGPITLLVNDKRCIIGNRAATMILAAEIPIRKGEARKP